MHFNFFAFIAVIVSLGFKINSYITTPKILYLSHLHTSPCLPSAMYPIDIILLLLLSILSYYVCIFFLCANHFIPQQYVNIIYPWLTYKYKLYYRIIEGRKTIPHRQLIMLCLFTRTALDICNCIRSIQTSEPLLCSNDKWFPLFNIISVENIPTRPNALAKQSIIFGELLFVFQCIHYNVSVR